MRDPQFDSRGALRPASPRGLLRARRGRSDDRLHVRAAQVGGRAARDLPPEARSDERSCAFRLPRGMNGTASPETSLSGHHEPIATATAMPTAPRSAAMTHSAVRTPRTSHPSACQPYQDAKPHVRLRNRHGVDSQAAVINLVPTPRYRFRLRLSSERRTLTRRTGSWASCGPMEVTSPYRWVWVCDSSSVT